MRDNFNRRTALRLAQRVGYRCSNPDCQRATVGAAVSPDNVLNIGVAAHITAASPGGPRFEEAISAEARSSAENGIWLCQSCAKLVDDDPARYEVGVLRVWKNRAEGRAFAEVTGLRVRRKRMARVCAAPLERLSPAFVGRSSLIESLRSTYVRGAPAQVLTGAGGVGKTQAALGFANASLHDYEQILWLVADSETSLLDSWRQNAAALGLKRAHSASPQELEFEVFNWLRTHEGWLAVLDNLEPVVLKTAVRWAVLPPTGNTLITSRERAKTSILFGKSVPVPPLARPDSVAFLFSRTGRRSAGKEENAAAHLLAELAGDLPLELESLAAEVLISHTSLDETLRSYRETGTRGGATWSHQVAALLSGDPATAIAMVAVAALAPEGVSSEIVEGVLREAGHPLPAATALVPAVNASIVEALHGTKYAMHRLLQSTIIASAGRQYVTSVAHAAVAVLLRLHPDEPEQPAAKGLCEALLPQVVALSAQEQLLPSALEVARLFELGGRFANEAGLYETAEELLNITQRRYEELGEQVADVALEVAARLAALKRQQGRFRESIAAYDSLLRRRVRRYGRCHRHVALTYNNLGNTLYDAGDITGAEKAYGEARDIWEDLGEGTSADAALTKNGLGNVLRRAGRLDEAEAAFRDAIATWLDSSEAPARFYPFALNGLGNVLVDRGRSREALKQFQLAERAWCAESGENHHHRAYALHNIGRCMSLLGRWPAAEKRFKAAWELRQANLGPQHPLTMRSRIEMENAANATASRSQAAAGVGGGA